MKISVLLLLALGFVAQLRAATVPLKYTRIDLSDGRTLLNVVVKSYDPDTGKIAGDRGRQGGAVSDQTSAATVPRQTQDSDAASGFDQLRGTRRETAAAAPAANKAAPEVATPPYKK